MEDRGGVPVEGAAASWSTLAASATVPWRALVAAALLSALLGVALWQGLAGRHSSVAPAAHFHASSHLRSRPSAQERKGLSTLPAGAQGPISQALGAENPAYRVGAFKGGFAASNPAQRLSSRFDRSGVALSSGGTHVGLSLRAVGYGSSLRALGEVAPRVKANRVFYERAGLSEWYANGPVGLEQGFTIPKALSAHPAGPLTLSMALSSNVHASLAHTGKSIVLSRGALPTLRYSGLSATDAAGHSLRSWLALQNGQIVLRVDARGARYPLRIDPFVQQGGKLTGAGERGEEGEFGYSVALSAEGTTTTALIGGPADNGKVGAAWVFTRTGSTWTQQGAKLTGKEEAGAGEFGKSVALAVEGTTTTALVGGPGDNGNIGAAWVFTRSGSTWTQQGAKLVGSGKRPAKANSARASRCPS